MVAIASAVILTEAVRNERGSATCSHNSGLIAVLAISGHAVLMLSTERILNHGGRLPTARHLLLVVRYAIVNVVVHLGEP